MPLGGYRGEAATE